MKFSATELKKLLVDGPFLFKKTLDVSELVASPDNDIRHIHQVDIDGICTMDKKELIFSFSIIGEMTLPCARTLVDVVYPFRFRATEIFSFAENIEDDPKEEEIHRIVEDTIDLKPYILENILLQMPYRVFSDEKGIEHGEGWNFYTEDEFTEEQSKKVDPRMEKLQQWLDKK